MSGFQKVKKNYCGFWNFFAAIKVRSWPIGSIWFIRTIGEQCSSPNEGEIFNSKLNLKCFLYIDYTFFIAPPDLSHYYQIFINQKTGELKVIL